MTNEQNAGFPDLVVPGFLLEPSQLLAMIATATACAKEHQADYDEPDTRMQTFIEAAKQLLAQHGHQLPAEMPDTIQHEGGTYHKTPYTGTVLPAGTRHGMILGETTHEYWLNGRDAVRLHAAAADPSRYFID